ncbi:MAG: hypothetical protein LBB61_00865 [Treponema sp.]|jgi:hypothetical protein|nr:hypothetical protein [Treponema sp.]
MKKIVWVLVTVVCAVSLYAQYEPSGIVLDDSGPVLNPDLMSYFQDEISSLMRYQEAQEEEDSVTPLFMSFRMAYSLEGGPSNDIINALTGGQFKLNNAMSIPVFAAMAYRNISGRADDGLLIDGFESRFGEVDDESWFFFLGSGLSFKSRFFQGSVFAGDHIKIFDGLRSFSVVYNDAGDRNWIFHDDESVTHSFKIALVPLIYTSEWRGVGRILNKAAGYIGMGDVIEFGEVKKDAAADMIVKALNFGIDLSFNDLGLGNADLYPEFFYRREHYDVAAKTDDYGAALELRGALKRGVDYSFAATLGYRHFYEVSPYFQSNYTDTFFYKFNLAFYLRPDDFFILGGLKMNIFCTYDTHRTFAYGFTVGIGDALTALFNYEGGLGMAIPSDFGLRYRAGGIRGFDKAW